MGDARPDGPSIEELVRFAVDHQHAGLRRSFGRMLALAREVEAAHPELPGVASLSKLLERLARDAERHMDREERIVFPMLVSGRRAAARLPVRLLKEESAEHAAALAAVGALARELPAAPEGDRRWRSLREALLALERELAEHAHLENNVIFPRALAGGS